MRFLDLLRMSSSNLWKRKIRTVLTILGVVIGTASIVVMISLGLGLNKSMMDSIDSSGGLTTIDVYTGGGGGGYFSVGFGTMETATSSSVDSGEEKRLDDALVETIRAMPHVEFASPVLNYTAVARQGAYVNTYFNLQGMTQEALIKKDIPLEQGRLPEAGGPLELVIGNAVVEDFSNPKRTNGSYWETGILPDVDLLNEPIFVIFDTDAYYQNQGGQEGGVPGEPSKSTPPPKKYMIHASGMAAGGTGNSKYNEHSWAVYCDIDALIAQLKKIFKNKAIPGQPTMKSGKPYKEIFYDSITVSVDDMEYVQEITDAINLMGYRAESNMSWVESMQEQYRSIQAVLGGIGAVSLFVAAIGITNTMMMSIYERTKEIGVIKVLGCSLGNIRTLFLLEAAYIGFIGGLLGLALSYGISAVINKVVSNSYGYETTTSYIPLWLAGAALAFAVLVGMVAGFFPALRAMRLSPLAAIRNE